MSLQQKKKGSEELNCQFSLICLAFFLTIGCGKNYILVRSRAQVDATLTEKPRINSTQGYREALPRIKTLAIRLPEMCLKETARQAEGEKGSDVIMSSDCGVWLSVLERHLAMAGYRVVSWDSVSQETKGSAISTYKAAQQLGVDALIMINSLETKQKTKADMTGESSAEFEYIKSDENGNDLGPLRLPQSTRNKLRTLTLNRWQLIKQNDFVAMTATVDVTIVLADSGQSIWFYQRELSKNLMVEKNRKILFRGREIFYRPVHPKNLTSDVELESMSSYEQTVKKVDKNNSVKARLAKTKKYLIENVSQDFVQRFKSGIL
jgi:hypothetical protein